MLLKSSLLFAIVFLQSSSYSHLLILPDLLGEVVDVRVDFSQHFLELLLGPVLDLPQVAVGLLLLGFEVVLQAVKVIVRKQMKHFLFEEATGYVCVGLGVDISIICVSLDLQVPLSAQDIHQGRDWST